MRCVALALAGLVSLAGCRSAPGVTEPTTGPAATPPVSQTGPHSGLYLQNFDRSVRPQDDLYRFVNGTWLRETEIPADRAEYGIFSQIDAVVERQLKAIAAESAADPAAIGERRLLGDFYASFMDEAAIEVAGLTPLRPELARIDAVRTPEDVLRYFARGEQLGIRNPLDPEIFADAKRPDVNVVWVEQYGLALPERDYYLKDDERLAAIRTKYVVYAAELLATLGHPDPQAAAQRVVALETRLARAAATPVELRDLTRIYNPFDLEGALKATPGLDWALYLGALGLPEDAPLVLRQPQFFSELGAALHDVPVATWQDYLRVRLLDSSAPYLMDALAKKHFAFHGTAISGTPEIKPRWKRALAEAELSIGDLLGKVYVARHFPPESKQRIDALVANFLRAFDDSIDELEWMDPSTRREAHAKVAALTVKVGYPEVWKTYPGLEIRPDDLLGNVQRARASAFERDRAKLGGRSTGSSGS
jgi:putative endopeptidase